MNNDNEHNGIKEIRKILGEATPKKSPRPRGSASINGSNNIMVGGNFLGDVNLNVKKTVRNTIEPGPEHISNDKAKIIKDLIGELVEKDVAGGGRKAESFQKWWSLFKNRFSVTSYQLLPAHQADAAISWLKQQSALNRPKLRRTNNPKWRTELYTAIWARSKQLGLSKADVYQIVQDRLGKQVVSLKSLGEQNLKSLYTIIMNKKIF